MGMLDGGGGCRPCDARCNEYLLLPLLAIPFFGDADVIVIRRAFASSFPLLTLKWSDNFP